VEEQCLACHFARAAFMSQTNPKSYSFHWDVSTGEMFVIIPFHTKHLTTIKKKYLLGSSFI